MLGTEEKIGVSKPTKAKLMIISTTVGPYFPEGFKPINLYCDDTKVRAWIGGHGNQKFGANYATGIAYTTEINKLNYQQLLWLVDDYVTEAGPMNFFVYWRNK